MTGWKEGEELRHIAASIEKLDDEEAKCRPKDDPYSIDPVVWAQAFTNSGDWADPALTLKWFSNAMLVNDNGMIVEYIYPWD